MVSLKGSRRMWGDVGGERRETGSFRLTSESPLPRSASVLPICHDKKLYTYGTKCYVGVSTWLHVLAAISQHPRVLPQPQLAMRSRRIYPSPQRRHHGQAADTLPPAPHLPMLYATGSSRSLSTHF